MEANLLKDDLVPQLWTAFTKSSEYKSGIIAIPTNHKLIIEQESRGLKNIYHNFIRILLGDHTIQEEIKTRKPSLWLQEWKSMHCALYKYVLKEELLGKLRKTEVRFGNPGDEDLHEIPLPHMVSYKLSNLAQTVQTFLLRKYETNEEKYITLAKTHYQFIKIHPFSDGNGRIARAITDQIAVFLGLPVAMGGFPRHDPKRRLAYHKAIFACIEDPNCELLAKWIQQYIERQLQKIA